MVWFCVDENFGIADFLLEFDKKLRWEEMLFPNRLKS